MFLNLTNINSIANGYYSDEYFNITRNSMLQTGHNPIVRMQIFQRQDNVCVCGVSTVIDMFKQVIPAGELKELSIFV